MILQPLLLVAAQAATLPHSGPSFECTAALTAVEQAVCDDAELSRLDNAMAAEYTRALRKLSQPARAALVRDQRWFLASNQEWFANRKRWDDFPDLRSRIRSRIVFLSSVQAARSTWAGRWGNLAGDVTVRQLAAGDLWLTFSTAQPANARWLCDFDIRGRAVEGQLAILAPHELAGRLRIELRDGLLAISDNNAERNFDFCGMNGSVAGEYLALQDRRSPSK